ncbi:MAG: ABC transporter permease [Verrucomicrobiales bacterium]
MTALHQKLWRDLAGMKGQGAAIALVIGCGVSMFVMAVGTLRALERSQETYYQRYRFADAFVSLKRAPLSVADRLAEIPGVAEVQPRISVAVNLGIDGVAEPIVGQVVSVLPRDRAQLNRLHLRAGRYPERGAGEVVVSAAFAEARGIAPGSPVEAVMNGRRRELSVVGVACRRNLWSKSSPARSCRTAAALASTLWMLREDLAAA